MARYKSAIIRFVGGPLHNQHKCVELRPYITAAIPPPLNLLVSSDHLARPVSYETCTYELARLRSPKGAIFFEYHIAGSDALGGSGDEFELRQDLRTVDLLTRLEFDFLWKLAKVAFKHQMDLPRLRRRGGV